MPTNDLYPEGWACMPDETAGPVMSADAQDDKGYSEETCVRCGWRMGSPPLNCQNDNTPHRFPSQQRQDEEIERLKRQINTAEWAMNEHREMREAAEARVQQLEERIAKEMQSDRVR